MNRFVSTRSEKRARQPTAGRAQCNVGSIEDEGIRYGFTTHALTASTSPTAAMIVTTQSRATRQGRGNPARRRLSIDGLGQPERGVGVCVQPRGEARRVFTARLREGGDGVDDIRRLVRSTTTGLRGEVRAVRLDEKPLRGNPTSRLANGL